MSLVSITLYTPIDIQLYIYICIHTHIYPCVLCDGTVTIVMTINCNIFVTITVIDGLKYGVSLDYLFC